MNSWNPCAPTGTEFVKIKNLKNLQRMLKARAREEEAEKLVSQTRKKKEALLTQAWNHCKKTQEETLLRKLPKNIGKRSSTLTGKREWGNPLPSCSLFVPFPNTVTWSQARYRSCRASPTYPRADKPGVRQQEAIIGHRQRYIKSKGRCAIIIVGNLPLKGVFNLLDKLLSLVVAPLLTGLVLTLVDHWLDD